MTEVNSVASTVYLMFALRAGSVTKDTKVVLVNVLHFLSDWLNPFDDVREGQFTTEAGEQVTVQMMNTETEMG